MKSIVSLALVAALMMAASVGTTMAQSAPPYSSNATPAMNPCMSHRGNGQDQEFARRGVPVSEIDTNGDGYISRAEMQAFHEKMKARHEQRQVQCQQQQPQQQQQSGAPLSG
jgi:hypothetical protein